MSGEAPRTRGVWGCTTLSAPLLIYPTAAEIRIWPRFLHVRWDANVDVRVSGGWNRGSGAAERINLDLHQCCNSRILPQVLVKELKKYVAATESPELTWDVENLGVF